MESVGIVVDSGSNFTPEEVKEYDFGWIPLHIVYPDGKTILDTPDLDPQSIYDDIATGKLTTSQPSPDTMESVLRQMLERYSNVVYFTLSSAFSGTYRTAKMVVNQMKEKDRIKVIDTRQMATGIDVFVMAVKRCMDSGRCTFESVEEYASSLWGKAQIVFLLETLEHLERSGRISKVKSVIGSLLRIMPIFYVDEEGYINTIDKVRGSIKKGLRALEKIIDSHRMRSDIQPRILIGRPKSSQILAFSEYLKEKLEAKVLYIRPTTAVHTGIWGIAVSFVDE